QSVQSIARLFKTSVQAVNRVLDEYALELLQEPNLRRSLMLEVTRLDQMLQAFYGKACTGDPAAAIICTKISQRRSCLLGLDPQAGFAVTVINDAGPPRQRTSTEEIHDALNDILGISPRQRELERREYNDEPMSDDERAELADYRAARAE